MAEGNGVCVLIGGGMCGILAAAGVARSFERLIILEKDSVPKSLEEYNSQASDKRGGVLQWQHPHAVAAGGLVKIEELLPGFKACCESQGAYIIGQGQRINDEMMQTWFGRSRLAPGTYGHPQFVMDMATRPLLERCARHLLLKQHANVELRTGAKVTSLLWDEDHGAVSGVHLKSGEELHAAFVVETSGANCHAVLEALREHGHGECEHVHVDPGLNYFTRFFKVPPKVLQQPREEVCQFAFHMPEPPDIAGRMWMRVEGDLYQANVAMLNKQTIGPGVSDFLEVFKEPHAPDPIFYEALKDAEPVGKMSSWLGYPGTIKRCFEGMRMPENYLVLGDAHANLNPRFGTGISVAAMQADMLGEVLDERRHALKQPPQSKLSAEDLRGLSNTAQKRASSIVDFAFGMVADGDLQFDFTTGHRTKNPAKLAIGKYMNWAQQLATTDTQVSQTILLVAGFCIPPTNMFQPAILRKILVHGAKSTWFQMTQLTRACTAVLCMMLAAGVLQQIRGGLT